MNYDEYRTEMKKDPNTWVVLRSYLTYPDRFTEAMYRRWEAAGLAEMWGRESMTRTEIFTDHPLIDEHNRLTTYND